MDRRELLTGVGGFVIGVGTGAVGSWMAQDIIGLDDPVVTPTKLRLGWENTTNESVQFRTRIWFTNIDTLVVDAQRKAAPDTLIRPQDTDPFQVPVKNPWDEPEFVLKTTATSSSTTVETRIDGRFESSDDMTLPIRAETGDEESLEEITVTCSPFLAD